MPTGERALDRTRDRVAQDRVRRGFTLIELLVVLALVSLLSALVAPRYFGALDKAKEQSLVTSLQVVRDAIDRFAADRGRYPDSLDELVAARYLRALPEDPTTGRRDTWTVIAPPPDSVIKGSMADIRSGSPSRARDGTRYADW